MKVDARKLTPEQQEQLRFKAIQLRDKGRTLQEIGQLLSVHPDTVGRWYKRYKTGGSIAISVQKRGPKNKPRRLTPQQEVAIINAVCNMMPENYQLGVALWSRRVIVALINQLWGIKIPIRTMGDYLVRWGFMPQKPLSKALAQNPSCVDSWLREEYPKVKEIAAAEGTQIYWVDDTVFRDHTHHKAPLVPLYQTTTPPQTTKPELLNMISAISNQGTVSFMVYRSTMTDKALNRFLRGLTGSTNGKAVLILDRLLMDKSNVLKTWIEGEEVKRQLKVFCVPS